MGSDAAEAVEILSIPSSFKVHRKICEQLMRLVSTASILLPDIEAARPRCSSGLSALCSLNQAIEKIKLVLQQCSESSKFYLVYTADAIILRCERYRKMLEQSLIQLQNNVPVLLAIQISQLVDDIRSATFTLDLSEEEAGNFVRQLVHRGASEVENFELNAFQSAVSRLHITSPRNVLIEKRSIRKLLNKYGDSDPKKKKILTYFFYLFKQYGNQIAEQSESINSESDQLVLNNNTGSDTVQRRRAHVENQTSPGDSLSDPKLLEVFKCPLSSRLMYDPVVIASGQTFERVWIQKWFDEGNDTCPKTKMKLPDLSVTPNAAMKDLISRWCTKYGVSISDPSAVPEIEPASSLDHSSASIMSLGSSEIDLHLQVDLSSLSFGSLDTSFSSDSSLSKITRGLPRMSTLANESSGKKSLELILRLSELPWQSQCELVEDFQCIVERNGQALNLASPANFFSPILRFLGEATYRGDIKAQRTGSQLLLAYLKKRRNGELMTEELFSLLASLLDSSDEVKEEALAIIETLCSQPLCMQKIAASGALALISDVLGSQSRVLQGSALRILNYISTDNDLRPLVFSLDSIIPKLVTFLNDTRLSLHALFILQNLCNIEAARIMITERGDCIASIARLLETGNNEEQEISLSIFLVLCSQRLEYCELVMYEGVIPALVHISVNGSEKSKVSALELLRLLRDVNYIDAQQDCSSQKDPDLSPPRDPSDHQKEKNKKSSSRTPRLFGMFSRARR